MVRLYRPVEPWAFWAGLAVLAVSGFGYRQLSLGGPLGLSGGWDLAPFLAIVGVFLLLFSYLRGAYLPGVPKLARLR